MGFNTSGATALAARLTTSASPRRRPIGVNLGKSKVTPIEDAARDYAASFEQLAPHADYVVVNVSSPNTPGLRSLQEKGPLIEILNGLQEIDRGKPLFVKIAPDLSLGEVDDVIEVVHDLGLAGIVATNTTLERSMLLRDPCEAGGLSGRPVFELSNLMLGHLKKSCNPEVTLIGVGGIFSADDLWTKIALGAHLCQIYTGWVYGGPKLIPQILSEFSSRLDREDQTLESLRGSLSTE
jgi:dihydroorotate dehydrogenase